MDLPTLSVSNSDQIEAGEGLVALGAPLGFKQTVNDGIVSQVRDWRGSHKVVQHTTPISPGSSGGPLLNRRGK